RPRTGGRDVTGGGHSLHGLQLRLEASRITALVADAQDLARLQVRCAVDRAGNAAVATADGMQAVTGLSTPGLRRVMPGRLEVVQLEFVGVDHATDEQCTHGSATWGLLKWILAPLMDSLPVRMFPPGQRRVADSP